MANADRMSQVAAAQRFKVGDVVVTALSDGGTQLNTANFVGIDEDGVHAALRASYIEPESYRGAINAFVVESEAGIVLIDSGGGDFLGAHLGRLAANLRAAGYQPSDISVLLMTHLHPDHVGGCVDGGAPVFANAEFVVSEAERAFWTDPAVRAKAAPSRAPVFDLVASALGAYGHKLRTFSGETEVVPGITSLPLPGHTPGHTGYRIESGGQKLLIWADIVHAAAVQLPHPDVTMVFDVDGPLAAKTRKALLERVAADHTLIAGMHMPFPGVGHIEKAWEGYRFVPAAWEYL